MFLSVLENTIDKNRKNYLFITKDYFNGNRKTQFGQNYYVLEALKSKYNVYILDLSASMTLNNELVKDKKNNYIIFDKQKYDKFKEQLKRKKESETAFEDNFKLHQDIYNQVLGNLNIDRVYVQAHDYSVLSPVSYGPGFRNDFFDYVGNDTAYMQKIENANKDTWETLWGNKLSPLAFLLYKKYVFYTLMYYIAKNKDVEICNVMTCDPTIAWPKFFEYVGLPTNFYYFVEDTRGTRNLKEFPLLQIRTLAGMKDAKGFSFEQKDFFYSGSILNDRSDYIRKEFWDRYLKNLNLDGSKNSIYTFLKYNSDSFKKSEVKGNVEKLEEYNLLDVYNEIKAHPMYKGSYENNNEYNVVKDYKYFLCLTPLTPYDSVNVRPGYVQAGVLPFFAKEYDPDNLYKIPSEIKDVLIVSNSKEIEDKVKYFNEHESERKDLINKLKKHFKLDEIKQDPTSEILKYL